MASTSPHATVRSRQRRDIQGLRAIAVILVVLQHLTGWPSGGYVGVDVFFVISGFLITGILLREQQRTGSISIAAFYARRLRRILPAAVLVIVVTVIVGYLVWYRGRADQNLLDGLAALVWIANYHFAATGSDYLAGAGTPPALQHYWSLSVEEQFYLVWPWFLMLVAAVAARLRRRLLVPAMVAVIVLSFTWSLLTTRFMPILGYYDSLGRAWELGVGGLLAVLLPAFAHRSTLRAWLSVAGLVTILSSSLLLTEGSAFPGPWAAWPVLGSMLVIAGTPGRGFGWILTNPISQRLGDISYSLYLWHFPVAIMALTVFGDLAIGWRLVLVAATIGLAAIGYWLVENPVRRSSWLKSWERTSTQPRHQWRIGIALIAAIGALAGGQYFGPAWGVIAESTFHTPIAKATRSFTSEAELQAAVVDGLSAQSYAGLIPSANDLVHGQLGPAFVGSSSCQNAVGALPVRTCVFGTGPRQALVVGDSVSLAWVPAVEAALGSTWTVTSAAVSSCSPFDVRHGFRVEWAAFPDKCAASRTSIEELITAMHPDLLVVADAAGGLSLVIDADSPETAWTAGVVSTLTRWRDLADRIVVLGNPPIAADPSDCLSRVRGPQACIGTLSEVDIRKTAAERAGAESTGTTYVDVTPWFCEGDRCPLVIGPYLSRVDTTHITRAMAEALGPVLAGRLLS